MARMTTRKRLHTMRYDDWIGLGADVLRREGPGALTIDNLCARARRTKGSFYHHFKAIGELRSALVQSWIDSEGEAVARTAAAGAAPRERLEAMWRLTATSDPPLELGIRSLAAADPGIAALVARADDRRELVMTTLLAAAYPIPGEDAHNLARLFHALHLGALVRAPDKAADFAHGPAKVLMAMLQARCT
jgi:AcrR family transcriptional regulator